jgi:hypothetical protein
MEGFGPTLHDFEAYQGQHVVEASNAHHVHRECAGLQDGVMDADYLAEGNESFVPPMKRIRIHREVPQLSEGSESELSVSDGIKHVYRDETWSHSFFTYETKPRGFFGKKGYNTIFPSLANHFAVV